MSGSWGQLVIGVKVNNFKEVQKLFAKLNKTVTLEQVKNNGEDDDDIIIENFINLDDHPHGDYTGDFKPQYSVEFGDSWTERRTPDDIAMDEIPIGINIFDSYGVGSEVPIEYILAKLTEVRKVLTDAKLYLMHEMS